jgi:hypothetical protein
MPYWTCDRCGARLYSASEILKWQDCPGCTGNLARRPEDPRRFDGPHEREPRVGQ